MPPAAATSADSSSTVRISCSREAPRAVRTANSRARSMARASSRLARFEHATSSTHPDRPRSVASRARPVGPVTESGSALAPPRGPDARFRPVGGRLRRQRGQEHVGLRRRHRGAASSEDGDRARRAIGARRGVEAQRAEDPDAAEQPVVGGGRREHAHDLVRAVRCPEAPPDDVGRAAELVLPQRRADEDDAMIAGDFVLGSKRPAHHGLHAQDLEQLRRHVEPFRRPGGIGERARRRAERGEPAEAVFLPGAAPGTRPPRSRRPAARRSSGTAAPAARVRRTAAGGRAGRS